MTKTQSDWIKRNMINVATIITLIGFIVTESKRQQAVESRLVELEKHVLNTEMHMPFKEKIELFVPRVELDQRLKNIEDYLIRIEKKIEK